MVELQLGFDEGTLLEGANVSWVSRRDIELMNLVLTNKNIYCVYKKSNGFFKKATEEVNAWPLADIKIINGQAFVQQVKYEGLWCLQIQFKRGTEYFAFNQAPKKVIPQWIAEINNSLGIDINDIMSTSAFTTKIPKRANPFDGIFTSAADAFVGVTDSLKSAVGNATESLKQTTTRGVTSAKDEETKDPVEQSSESLKRGSSFCMNCGAELMTGAQFCSVCGNQVGDAQNDAESTVYKTAQTPPPIMTMSSENITPSSTSRSQRQQEYVGTIKKCPNCGSVISETTVVCPDCGMRITGRAAITSVQAFKDQLMEIESTRKRGLGGALGVYLAADPADIKKLSLIRNFPIPNTVDDIMEFMFLAVANIDVSLSKNTVMNKWNNTQQIETGATIGRTISNAWVAKMQQAYQKAEMLFPEDPIFGGIQKLYFDKMKELKIKV